MSDTVHYTPNVTLPVRKMLRAIPCGIGKKDRELVMTSDPAKVDCPKCRAALKTEPPIHGHSQEKP